MIDRTPIEAEPAMGAWRWLAVAVILVICLWPLVGELMPEKPPVEYGGPHLDQAPSCLHGEVLGWETNVGLWHCVEPF